VKSKFESEVSVVNESGSVRIQSKSQVYTLRGKVKSELSTGMRVGISRQPGGGITACGLVQPEIRKRKDRARSYIEQVAIAKPALIMEWYP
jgi:hypothetical protein